MLDIRLFRENPKLIKESLKKRKDDDNLKLVDQVVKKDEEYRKLLQQVEKLRHRRNEITSEINQLKKDGKKALAEIKEAKDIPSKIKKKEEKLALLKSELRKYLMGMPNIIDKSVPYGKDESDNVEVRKWGKIPKPKYPLLSHGELAESLGIADFKNKSINS